MNGHVVGINASIQTATENQTRRRARLDRPRLRDPDRRGDARDPAAEKGETPTHARLGISVQNVAAGQGALVADGARDQRRERRLRRASAGLKNGDVITKVDDTLITDADGLVATVRSYRPGDKVTVTYTRDGDEHTVDPDPGLGLHRHELLTPDIPFQGSGPTR